jgi:hypothetical protein
MNGDFRTRIFELAEQNRSRFLYWHEAGALNPPDIGDANAVASQAEDAADRLDALFATKQANLTEAMSDPELDDTLAAWEDVRSQLTVTNSEIEALLTAIRSLKDSIDTEQLSRLQNELKILQATKRRHEADISDKATNLERLRQRRQQITDEKSVVRDELNEYERTTTANLGAGINSYLKRLRAGFTIDYQAPNYRGGREPAASYNLLIRDVPVSPRSGTGERDQPSFRNTLSSGDKSTLALAFFLAKVNADPDIASTIVVLDDPFTSLDHFRRQFTANEIRKLCARAQQTIVLSH